MATVNCELCGDLIHPDRIEAIPSTTVCINCSDKVTDPIVGFMIYAHKTAGEVIMTSGTNAPRSVYKTSLKPLQPRPDNFLSAGVGRWVGGLVGW